MALSYFLTIDGIFGDSTSDSHEGAFDIIDYKFDVNAIESAATGGGSGSSKAAFSPLTVDLDLTSGLTSLLKDIATGKTIRSIELQGVSADGETLYDLRLGDVVLTTYHDSNTGHDMLSFSYQQVSLTTTPQNSDGSLGTPVTFSFDLAAGKQDVDIPPPAIPAGGPSGGGAQTYYLTVDGIFGDSTSEAHKGAFDVVGYHIDVGAIVDAATGGGGGSFKAAFAPLHVDLGAVSDQAALLRAIATGQHIRSVELTGVSADGQTVYDLKLGDVFVDNYGDANGHDSLSFTYQQVSLTTTSLNSDGSPGTSANFSFNVATNRADAVIPDPVIPEGSSSGDGAQRFFLTIDGVFGNSTTLGHQGAFDVFTYNFDVDAAITAASGGSGSSKPTFTPLKVTLALSSGQEALLRDIATGTEIPSIELKGVSSDRQTVYDLKLGHVHLSTYLESSGQGSLQFDYEQISLTTTPIQSDGTLGTPFNFSFDLALQKQDVVIPDPVPAGDPTGGSAQTYYLMIDGVAGDSTSEAHQGAFQIKGYSFDVNALIGAATGGGSSKPDFLALRVNIDLNSGQTALLRDIATGEQIPSVEIKGVTDDGLTVYDLKLGDVFVTNYAVSNGSASLSFDYQKISLTTTPLKSDGTLGTPATFSFDVNLDKQGAVIPDPVVPTSGTTGSSAQAYFLTIDGISGDSTSDAHKGAFDVIGYTFDVSALVSEITGSGNRGSEASFTPLQLGLDLSSGQAGLLRDLVTGHEIRSIEIKGVSSDGQTVYDLRLGHVVLTSYFDTNNGHDGLTFDYRQISLTTTPQNSNGSLGTPVTFSFDLDTKKDATIPPPVAPASDGIGVGAHTFYLTIDGIFGDSTSAAHSGAFDLVDYSFNVQALVSGTSGGGGSSSRPTFSPLRVDLDLNAGLAVLLKDVSTGEHIRSIELKGAASDGKTVYDLKLGDVTLTTYHDSNSGHDMLSFDYQQMILSTTPENADGTPGTPVSFAFDLTTNKLDANIPDPVVNHPPIALDDAAVATTGIGGTASGNVLANDTDPDGDHLAVTPFSAAGAHGNLTLNADGSFSYIVTNLTGATGSHLHDVFAYTETDGRGGTASANLDITLNRAPDALDDAAVATTGIGGTASGNVLANDSEPDGDHLAVTPFSGAGAHGNLTLNADGSFSYIVTNLTGPTGSHLHDVFAYTETDGNGGTASANLDMTLDRAPDVLGDIAGVKIGAASTGNVLGNDTDPDGDTLSVTAISGGSVGQAVAGKFGTLVLNSNGSYSYTATHGASGSAVPQDIFSFTESDGHGGVVESSLTFSIISNGQSYFAGTPGETITAGNGKGILDGSLGAQHLLGGNGTDVLVGGGGDVLTGGNGGDTFVFKGDFGKNEITDFKKPDQIQLDKSAFGSANDILTHFAANDGHGNTIITDPHNAANVITLDHVTLNQLHASDFQLV